jgi:dTDP-4-dehydrorhamnose reductase
MWLVVGGDSEIGGALFRRIQAGEEAAVATTRRRTAPGPGWLHLDLADPLERFELPESTTGVCIAAAVARLADCESDPARSAAINVTATLNLANRLLARGIFVVFLSSNQVFDGHTPHVAADAPTNPVSEYGKQKARVENELRAAMAQGAPAAILRLAKVVSPRTPLFRNWVAALAAGRPIRTFGDMTLAPTPVDLVAEAIIAVMRAAQPAIFQLTGPRDMSYADVGRYLARSTGAREALIEVVSAASAAMPKGANPRHTTLDSSLLRTGYGIAVADIWDVLTSVLSALPGYGCRRRRTDCQQIG